MEEVKVGEEDLFPIERRDKNYESKARSLKKLEDIMSTLDTQVMKRYLKRRRKQLLKLLR